MISKPKRSTCMAEEVDIPGLMGMPIDLTLPISA